MLEVLRLLLMLLPEGHSPGLGVKSDMILSVAGFYDTGTYLCWLHITEALGIRGVAETTIRAPMHGQAP